VRGNWVREGLADMTDRDVGVASIIWCAIWKAPGGHLVVYKKAAAESSITSGPSQKQ
jgi:hypothetical protein